MTGMGGLSPLLVGRCDTRMEGSEDFILPFVKLCIRPHSRDSQCQEPILALLLTWKEQVEWNLTPLAGPDFYADH